VPCNADDFRPCACGSQLYRDTFLFVVPPPPDVGGEIRRTGVLGHVKVLRGRNRGLLVPDRRSAVPAMVAVRKAIQNLAVVDKAESLFDFGWLIRLRMYAFFLTLLLDQLGSCSLCVAKKSRKDRKEDFERQTQLEYEILPRKTSYLAFPVLAVHE